VDGVVAILGAELVVEADVAAGHRGAQRQARLAQSLDRFHELMVDLRDRGVAEVQVVGHAERRRPDAGEVAGRLGHGEAGAAARREVDVAGVAVDGRGHAATGALESQHAASPAPGSTTVLVMTWWSYCR
jgi:hypothetical protein